MNPEAIPAKLSNPYQRKPEGSNPTVLDLLNWAQGQTVSIALFAYCSTGTGASGAIAEVRRWAGRLCGLGFHRAALPPSGCKALDPGTLNPAP